MKKAVNYILISVYICIAQGSGAIPADELFYGVFNLWFYSFRFFQPATQARVFGLQCPMCCAALLLVVDHGAVDVAQVRRPWPQPDVLPPCGHGRSVVEPRRRCVGCLASFAFANY